MNKDNGNTNTTDTKQEQYITVKTRLYPTQEQTAQLVHYCDAVRYTKNIYQKLEDNNYKHGIKYKGHYDMYWIVAKKNIQRLDSSAVTRRMLYQVPSSILNAALKDKHQAYQNFFDETLPHKHPKYQKARDGNSFTTSEKVKIINGKIYLPKFRKDRTSDNGIRIADDRDFMVIYGAAHARIYTITISQSPVKQWYVSITYAVTAGIPLLPRVSDRVVGIDVGLTDILITSDGDRFNYREDPRAHDAKIKACNQWMRRQRSKGCKGAVRRIAQRRVIDNDNVRVADEWVHFDNTRIKKNNVRIDGDRIFIPNSQAYEKVRIRKAKIQEQIARKRKHEMYQWAHKICAANQRIYMEPKFAKNLIKNKHMARSIAEASWNNIKIILTAVAAKYGSEVIEIPKGVASTQICSSCNYKNKSIKGMKNLAIRKWTCPSCGTHHDRDINAAMNIKNVGEKEYNRV